jgi:hypothetical protein
VCVCVCVCGGGGAVVSDIILYDLKQRTFGFGSSQAVPTCLCGKGILERR